VKHLKEIYMKVVIEDGCIACGACESICDAVFTVEDVVVVNSAGIPGNEDAVKEAADACPVGVIVVTE
jgi:ferredoxin